jgi:hypothetical protein
MKKNLVAGSKKISLKYTYQGPNVLPKISTLIRTAWSNRIAHQLNWSEVKM